MMVSARPAALLIARKAWPRQHISTHNWQRCQGCRPTAKSRSTAQIQQRRRLVSSSSSKSSKKKDVSPPEHPSPSPASPVQYQAPKAFAVGTVAGMMGSLAGMGGGFVMIPLMTSSLLRLSQHSAHGTSLFAVAATGIAGAISYGAEIEIEYDSAAALAGCGMITARLGAQMTSKLSERRLKIALGIFMLCVAPLVPAKAYVMAEPDVYPMAAHHEHEKATQSEITAADEFKRLAASATIGLWSGFLAGLFGVGGGAIVVPALTLTTDMNHCQALGTSLLAMTLPACVGTLTHYQRGNVAMRVAPALAAGAFAGAFLGAKIATNLEEDKLRWGFSGLMLFLGTKTLMKA